MPRALGEFAGLLPRHALHERGHSTCMNAALFLHSPSLAQSSHLMSSSAHKPGTQSCSAPKPHQLHVFWQCFAMKRRLRWHCPSRFHASQSGSKSLQGSEQSLHERWHFFAIKSALAAHVAHHMYMSAARQGAKWCGGGGRAALGREVGVHHPQHGPWHWPFAAHLAQSPSLRCVSTHGAPTASAPFVAFPHKPHARRQLLDM